MPESCLRGLCKELHLSAVTAQILLVVYPPLNLVSSPVVTPASLVFPMAGWVQADCLGHGAPFALHSALSAQTALLCPRLFGIFTSHTQPRAWIDQTCQHRHLPKGSSPLPWLPQPVFLFRDNWGIWSWFREGFVPSHFCDSDIWEERKGKERMWSLKKISLKTCQTRIWLARN